MLNLKDKVILPFVDSIEFLTLAFSLQDTNDLVILAIRSDREYEKFNRFKDMSVAIDDIFKKRHKTVLFHYTNIENQCVDLSNKLSKELEFFNLNRKILENTTFQLFAQQSKEALLPYSISDLYLEDFLFEHKPSTHHFNNLSKKEVYKLATSLKVPTNFINEYRVIDTEKANSKNISHHNIAWAHKELAKDGWACNLEKEYSIEEREALLFVWNRRRRGQNS
jgi:hypothetical protein